MPPGPYANFWTMNSSSWRGTQTEAPPLRCWDRPLEGLPEVLKSPAEGKSRFPIFRTSPKSELSPCTFHEQIGPRGVSCR